MKAKNKTSLQFTPAIFDTYHKQIYVKTALLELVVQLSSQIEEDYNFVLSHIRVSDSWLMSSQVIPELKESKGELMQYIKERQTKFLKGEY